MEDITGTAVAVISIFLMKPVSGCTNVYMSSAMNGLLALQSRCSINLRTCRNYHSSHYTNKPSRRRATFAQDIPHIDGGHQSIVIGDGLFASKDRASEDSMCVLVRADCSQNKAHKGPAVLEET